MQPFPSLAQKVVDAVGKIIQPWNSYLQQFTQAPPKFTLVTVTASPFTYEAVEPGYLILTGGVISILDLIRGTDIINLTGQKIIPVSIADSIEVTYSVLPTINFVPIYGANTNV